jgi:type VI secretion system FHA domain protein
MPLRITTVSYCGRPAAERVCAVFSAHGGTLGRAPDNDLVLPDPEKVISRAHAAIRFENGAYFLFDTSLAGTAIINRGITLRRDSAQFSARLEDGDRLRIGDYDLAVAITGEEAQAFPGPQAGFASEPYFPGPISGIGDTGEHDDLERLLNSHKSPESAGCPPHLFKPAPSHTSDELRSPAHNESFIPPPTAAEAKIPPDFNLADLLRGLEEPEAAQESADFPEIPSPGCEGPAISAPFAAASEPQPLEPVAPGPLPEQVLKQAGVVSQPAQPQEQTPLPPVPPVREETASFSPPPAPPASSDAIRRQAHEELAALFCKAAGIEAGPSLPPEEVAELLRAAGAFIREITAGLMAMLRGRMEMKNQFRVSRTIIRTAGNNPLKFSLTAEDALKLLFVDKKPGFLPAVEAVQQGCRDIMQHELAATAANQAALIAILKQFDPEKFNQQFKDGFVLQKKSKCWDMYCRAYPELVTKAQDNFYGEDFAQAYEQQMQKIKAGSRG